MILFDYYKGLILIDNNNYEKNLEISMENRNSGLSDMR